MRRGYMSANAVREQDKNPQARLEKFLRNAHRGGGGGATTAARSSAAGGNGNSNSNTNSSGAFGGKPQTFRRGGAPAKKKALSVPAWMIGEEAAEAAEAAATGSRTGIS